MFKSEKIYRALAVIPKNNIQKIISLLHKKSICQIKEAENDMELVQPLDDEQKTLNLYSRLSFVIESLEQYSNKQSSNIIKELFFKKKIIKIKRKSLTKKELFSKVEKCFEIIEETIRINIKGIKKIEEKISENEYIISNLKHIPELQTDLLKDTINLRKVLGIIHNSAIEKIEKEIKNKAVIIQNPIDKKTSLMIILFKHGEEIEKSLHEVGFEEINIPFKNIMPKELIKNIKEENIELTKEENKIYKEQHKLYISYNSLLAYFHDELRILKEKIDALAMTRTANSFATLECWIPSKNLKQFNNILEENAKGYYLSYLEQDNAPTLLNNPKIIKPFESITELYSLPKYNSIDPTPILAITFSFFFGFMLTDFVYGSALLIFGLLLIRGKGSYDEKTKNIGIILTTFGAFTAILGMAFGSYFGDFFQRIGINVPMLIDSLNQVMIVLIIALTIGMIHLLSALLIGFYENMKNSRKLVAMQNQGVWILFIFSLISFILQNPVIGYTLLTLSLLTQIGLTFKKSGGISSLLSIFSFPGFIGDLFSYGRLMALAIGTTGIALAVNFMTLMAWDIPYAGPIAAAIIFIIGHTFNMAMNGLGAFVHSVRLHFLEFFSKFYEGSGKKYIPFGIEK